MEHKIKKMKIILFLTMVIFFPLVLLSFTYAQTKEKPRPKGTVNLGFFKGGVVTKVYVKIGDKVKAGQQLIELDKSELLGQLQQLKAVLQIQKAQLKILLSGSKPEAIKIEEARLEGARIDLEDAKKNLVFAIQDAYTRAEDAVRGKADQFFANGKGPSPQVTLPNYNVTQTIQIEISNKRFLVEQLLINWKASLETLKLEGDFGSYALTAKQNLSQIKNFLELAAYALDSSAPDRDTNSTTLRNWRTDVSAGRTNVNTAIKNLSSAETKLKETETKLALAKYQLDAKTSGDPVLEARQILQEGKVQEAEAKIEIIKSQLNRMTLFSPIKGVVTSQNAKTGMIISKPTNVISISPQ